MQFLLILELQDILNWKLLHMVSLILDHALQSMSARDVRA